MNSIWLGGLQDLQSSKEKCSLVRPIRCTVAEQVSIQWIQRNSCIDQLVVKRQSTKAWEQTILNIGTTADRRHSIAHSVNHISDGSGPRVVRW